MEWNLKDFGDSIEKSAYKILSPSECKSYTLYWGSFVGNKNGNSIHIEGITEEQNRLRLLLGQWCYMVLRNQVFIHMLESKLPSKIDNEKRIVTAEFVYFQAVHVFYNTVELIGKYNGRMNKPDIKGELIDIEKYDNFIKMRNVIAHNLRTLIKYDGKNFQVPSNFNWFTENDTMNSESWLWEEFNFSKIEYARLSDFLTRLKGYNSDLLKKVSEKSFEITNKITGGMRIPKPNSVLERQGLPLSNISTPPSGSM